MNDEPPPGFRTPGAWKVALDQDVERGLVEYAADQAARTVCGLAHIVGEFRGRWILHATTIIAAAARRLGPGEARALLVEVLAVPSWFYDAPPGGSIHPFVGAPLTKAEVTAGVLAADDGGRVLLLADTVGLGAEVRATLDALLAVPAQVRPGAERLEVASVAWAPAFVE